MAFAHLSALSSAEPAGGRSAQLRMLWYAVLVLLVAMSAAACTSSGTKHRSPASKDVPASGPVAASGVPGPRAATTPVSARSSGDIHHTEAVRQESVRAPVALSAVGNFGGRVTVRVAQIAASTTHARVRGEVSGPGLVVTLRVDNASAKPVDLGNVVVALEDDTGAPAIAIGASPSRPLIGSVAPDAYATGVYVFTVPASHRSPITLRVSYTTMAPVVVFVGRVT